MTPAGRLLIRFKPVCCAAFWLNAGLQQVAIPQEPATDNLERSIRIESSSLGDVLFQIALIYDVPVLAAESLVEGKTAIEISGSLTVSEALSLALQGTGLQASRTEAGTYVVSAVLVPVPDTPKRPSVDDNATPLAKRTEEREAIMDEVLVDAERLENNDGDWRPGLVRLAPDEFSTAVSPSLNQLLERVPNVNTSFGGGGLVIRGVAQNGVVGGLNPVTANLTLGLSVDNIPLATSTQTLLSPATLWDVEEIEVFKGAQSSSQGRGAIAGSIALSSREPTNEFSSQAQLVQGSFGTEQYSVAVSGPIFNDTISARLSYDQRRFDGFISSNLLDRDDIAAEDQSVTRLKLRWQPTGAVSARFTAMYSDAVGSPDLGFELDEFIRTGQRFNNTDQPQRRFDESLLLGGTLDWAVADRLKVSSFSSFVQSDSGRDAEADGTSEIIGSREQRNSILSFDQKLSATFAVNDNIDALGEVSFAYIDAESSDTIVSAPGDALGVPGTLLDFQTRSAETTRHLSVYSELDWRLSVSTRIVAGLRFADDEVTADSFGSAVFSPALIDAVEVAGVSTSEFSAWLPTVHLFHRMSDEWTLAAGYSRGYRPGGTELTLFGTFSPFDAEYTDNFELSIKSKLFGERAALDVTAFYTNWTDQQVIVSLLEAVPEFAAQVPDGVATTSEFFFITANAAESEIFGVELSANFRLSDEISGFAVASLSETHFDEFPLSSEIDLAGTAFRFAPNYSLSLGIEYEHASGIVVGGSLFYSDGIFSDFSNSRANATSPFTVVDFKAEYRAEHFSLGFFLNNALDENFLTFRDTAVNFGSGGSRRVFGSRVALQF